MQGVIGYAHERQAAADEVYEQSGLGPEDFQVIELHDCFAANELLLYEALGLCAEGEAPQAHRQRRHHLRRALGGQPVRRSDLQGPSARGDRPRAVRRADLAAARQADNRQVDGVTAALQHNIGLGGAAVVTAYQRAER